MKKTLATQRSPAMLLPYARLLLKTGKITEAAEAVEDLLAIKPDTFPALMLKIEILKQQKNYDGIITVCKEIGYIDAHYVPALYERAEAHRQQGKAMWAEKYYRDILKADPKFARAEIGLAEIAKERDKPDEYRKHIMQAYKLDPNDSLVLVEYQKAMAQ
jgi:tetratricopeptide (TPR) repeat protein